MYRLLDCTYDITYLNLLPIWLLEEEMIVKIDMKEMFENIKYYLENDFIKEMEDSTEANKQAWAELQEAHLRVANTMIIMAESLQEGRLTTRASELEAMDTLNYIYTNFLNEFPDKAFINQRAI